MNSMCERCPGWSCCCLDYNGDACQHWRANNAPDVVFTNYDALKAMDKDELSDQLVITITGLSDLTMHLAAPVGKMFISEKAAVQTVKDWMDEEADEETIAALAVHMECEEDEERPLTLEELRQMNGQPVWCESLKTGLPGAWAIIKVVELSQSWFLVCSGAEQAFGDKDNYGKTWVAYRRPPRRKRICSKEEKKVTAEIKNYEHDEDKSIKNLECVSKEALVEWLRPYLQSGEPIPADLLSSHIQMMPPTLILSDLPILSKAKEGAGSAVEPVRCTGCFYLDEEIAPCAHCIRAAGYADYYKPMPEREDARTGGPKT